MSVYCMYYLYTVSMMRLCTVANKLSKYTMVTCTAYDATSTNDAMLSSE